MEKTRFHIRTTPLKGNRVDLSTYAPHLAYLKSPETHTGSGFNRSSIIPQGDFLLQIKTTAIIRTGVQVF